MASTQSSTQAELPFEGGEAAPETDPIAEVEDELARLVQAKYAPRISGAFGATMLDADQLRPPTPRAAQSRGRRGTLAGVAIAVCLSAWSIWAWRSHDGPAEDIVAAADPPSSAMPARLAADPVPPTSDPAPAPAAAPPAVEMPAPPPAQAAAQGGRQAAPQAPSQARSIVPPAAPAANAPGAAAAQPPQAETSDIASLRERVELLAAGQRKLTVDIARLQAAKPDRLSAQKPDRRLAEKPPAETPHRRPPPHVSAHRAPPAAAPTHKTAAAPARKTAAVTPMPPQAARQASVASPVSAPPRPALQVPAGPQSADAPLRPPASVPQL
jgi:hypothetical protein